MGIRSRLRNAVPLPLRQHARALLRWSSDIRQDVRSHLGTRERDLDLGDLRLVCEVSQAVRRSTHWEGKLSNLRLGATRLERVCLGPGQLFSFWHFVGNPSAKRGFATGRSIQSGRVQADTGGGLCQLSGLCYELALRAGLEIRERFPHSHDLYDDTTRFTPLGLDATVVWGVKDLRFVNPHPWPVLFAFEVSDQTITGRAFCKHPIVACELDLSSHADPATGAKEVMVRRRAFGGEMEKISHDVYGAPPISPLLSASPAIP
jgi:vancomycin resistance protein VanW